MVQTLKFTGYVCTAPTTQRIMYVLSWRTVSAPTRGLFWYLFPKLQSNKGNKHQNNTLVSAETVHHESTYNVLFLTWHTESINDDKNDDLYTSSPCLTCSVFVLLMTSQSIAYDITMTRQLWCDHVNSDFKWVKIWILFMAIFMVAHVKNLPSQVNTCGLFY